MLGVWGYGLAMGLWIGPRFSAGIFGLRIRGIGFRGYGLEVGFRG